MKYDKRILFLGHDATRTGTPLLMLELIKWLRAHSSITPSVLLKRGGEIESDYSAVASTRCYAEEFDKLNDGIRRKVLRNLRRSTFSQPNLARLYPPEEYPVVYANTIDTCDLAVELAGRGRRLIHHIHELAYITDYFAATDALKRAVPVTDVYIAASRAVGRYLEDTIGVPAAKIKVIHEFPIAVTHNDCRDETRLAVRRRLGISDNAFVVGICGLPHWRKGTDLFVQVAMHAKRLLKTVTCHFVWLGGDARSHAQALYDVAQSGLEDRCHFLAAVRNPEAYYSVFDLFALTSREDPFSVAMLEAALCGLPIVCFAGAGGGPELVEDDAGIIVPYLDVPAMAKGCIELMLDDKRRQRLGGNARAKVQSRYMLATQRRSFLPFLRQPWAALMRQYEMSCMTISVVIPTYNSAPFIRETLESVLAQIQLPGRNRPRGRRLDG